MLSMFKNRGLGWGIPAPANTRHLLFIPLGFAPPGRRIGLAGGVSSLMGVDVGAACPCPTVLAVQNPARASLCSCALVCTLQIQIFNQVFLPFPGSRAALPDCAEHQAWALPGALLRPQPPACIPQPHSHT